MRIPIVRQSMILCIFLLLFSITDVHSRSAHNINYDVLTIDRISRFNEDRIVFQHVERDPIEFGHFEPTDNSISTLLVIKKKRMYMFKDGFDNPKEVIQTKTFYEMANKLISDLWVNKIDGEPDFVKITDRRLKLMEKIVQQDKDKEGNVTLNKNLAKNYTDMYNEIKDKFLQNHANILRKLIVGDKEAVYVQRTPIPSKIYEKNVAPKFFISVTAKTLNGIVYYAEDADGDGLTETFTVGIKDGFNWGYRSGPNILLIYNCQYKDASGKETNAGLKRIIGSLTKEAYYGTTIEEEKLTKTLEKEKQEIKLMIDDLYRIAK